MRFEIVGDEQAGWRWHVRDERGTLILQSGRLESRRACEAEIERLRKEGPPDLRTAGVHMLNAGAQLP